jgi:8-oxo-dGTP pyrophosphatase MutT (NUDIX family)
MKKLNKIMSEKDFYQISLKVILKNNKNEILILKDLDKGSFAGFYDLPGGRIDKTEFSTPFPEIIRREIIEECGNIKISLKETPVVTGRHLVPAEISSENKELHILYLFFEAELLEGDITVSDEHSEYKWIKLNEINPEELFKSGILEGIKMYINQNK